MTIPETDWTITYRVSALIRAFTCLARAAIFVAPAVLANAIIQAVLLAPGVLPGISIGFILISAASYLVLVAAYTLVATSLLSALDGNLRGRMGVGDVVTQATSRFAPVLGWSTLLLVATVIGLSLYVIPGFAVLAILPFLLIAVIDRRRAPLAVNFSTIAAVFGRWLLTIVIMAGLCAALWLLATATGFFVGGWLGPLFAWIALGAIASWFTAAWMLIYRSVNPPGDTSRSASSSRASSPPVR